MLCAVQSTICDKKFDHIKSVHFSSLVVIVLEVNESYAEEDCKY